MILNIGTALRACLSILTHVFFCNFSKLTPPARPSQKHSPASIRPYIHPVIQSIVRPTDCPSSLTATQNKYCVECYDIYSIHSHYKGNHKRVAMKRVDVVALNTIFALRLSKTRRTVGRTDSRLDGWSVHTNDWSGKRVGLHCKPFLFYVVRFLIGPLSI